MKAIALIPGTTEINLVEREEPRIERPDEVKIKVLEVGICGTDRELVQKGRAEAPPGEKDLILGHEMLGKVVEVGKGVSSFKVGDLAVVTVRRGCEKCPACLHERPDLCYLDAYTERGIRKQHGFQAEYVVDREQFLVNVPPSMRACGVLCEPMSVVEKAIEEILSMQKTRLPDWSQNLGKKQALVAGLGPIGLLACFALKLRGFKLFALDIVDRSSSRVQIVEDIGGTYIDGNKIQHKEIPDQYGHMDLIVEAAGRAELNFHLMHALGPNGGYVLTGVVDHTASFNIPGGHLMYELVLKNQLVLGSVNAAKKHWDLAIQQLQQIEKTWPKHLSKLITSRTPYEKFRDVFEKRSPTDIKCVLEWDGAKR